MFSIWNQGKQVILKMVKDGAAIKAAQFPSFNFL